MKEGEKVDHPEYPLGHGLHGNGSLYSPVTPHSCSICHFSSANCDTLRTTSPSSHYGCTLCH